MPLDPHPPPARLDADDFDAQDDVLDALREHAPDTPDWEFCEGFLAALVCCRRVISADEYWPALLGAGFQPMAHMAFVYRWRQRWAEVAQALDEPVEDLDDARCYHPELVDMRGLALDHARTHPENAHACANLPAYAQNWALGFLTAVEAWPDDWRAPRDPDTARMLEAALADLHIVAGDDSGPPTVSMHREDGPASISERRLDDLAAAIWAVYDLRQLWQSLGPRAMPERKTHMPGRNDPCPCGSGQKFKKCHGRG